MTIKFKKILENAVQPVRVVNNGAGYNLVAKDVTTEMNKRGQVHIVYRTGLGVEIPEGYVGVISTPDTLTETTLRMTSAPIISGNIDAIAEACEQLKAAGAKRALPLKVGGAFHSPLMQPAKDELQAAIEQTEINTPVCPVYQNVDGKPHTNPAEIKQNLIAQLTSSVRWTQCVQNMIADGADDFTECGPGKALQGMIVKIDRNVNVHGIA